MNSTLLQYNQPLERWTYPLFKLFDSAAIKTFVGAGLALLGELLTVQTEYLALLVLLLAVDLVTGMWAALRRKERISSIGLRQTLVKVVEYVGTLLVVIATANTFQSAEHLEWMRHLDDMAFAYIALTEIKSVTENLGATPSRIWNKILKALKSKADGMLDDDE